MASWNELLTEIEGQPEGQGPTHLQSRLHQSLQGISYLRDDRNVLIYASGFLQKPEANQSSLQLTHEEINGFMSVMYGMDWEKGLTLILHTPGGVTNATETIVAYLNDKFEHIEAIVPTYAMSAGTMISLACERVIMGRPSQLGPIDPQMLIGNRSVSARSIVDQFERAKTEVLDDGRLAHVWAPILQTIGPAILQEAHNALEYGERMVAEWLAQRMFKNHGDPDGDAKRVAQYFNDASAHKSHGRRIDRNEARSQGVVIEDLEDTQELQDKVLTAYHLATILFEKTITGKFIAGSNERLWVKNLPVQA